MSAKIAIFTLTALMLASRSFAADGHDGPRFYESLKRLDPSTRLDQLCDYEAMLRIADDPNPYHPDRAKAEVLSAPKRSRDAVIANGAAFRSGGRWYALTFSCAGDSEHMKITHFTYKIGKVIPESEWPHYGLWK